MLIFASTHLLARLVGLSGAWRTLALGFQCVDFCVNTSFGMPGGTESFNMVDIGDASEVNEGTRP